MDSVLYSAAADGDFNKFEEHSNRLEQILTTNGNTILHIHITARARPSSISENIDFVRRILGKCSDLLWKDNKKGETLLHMAARHGHADVAKYLLEECKNTPYQNQYGDQELGITATRRMLQTTSHDMKDTALHEAVRYHHREVVLLLIKEDPQLTYKANRVGETPVYLTAERGYKTLLKEILSTCTSPADDGPYDRTALHVAVIRKDKDMITSLLAKERIQKSKKDQKGWTPLHFAAHLGYFEILEMLLDRTNKSVAYIADNEGKTALHVAAGLGRVDVMQKFISTYPDCCEIVDKRGWNVLHFALESRNKKAIKLILDNPWLGNLINEKDENGNTPFLKAISMGIGYTITMKHPKLDVAVFNHHNHNAVDILLANKISHSWFFEMMPGFFSQVFEKLKVNLDLPVNLGLRMIVSENEIIGEGKDKGNTVRSKSKDGEVEDEGKRMSSEGKDEGNTVIRSKSYNGEGENKSIVNFMEKVRDNELVAATLIATVTFAAGFTVPGGFVADKGPDQGAAILTRNTAFRAFVILNTMSMFLSSLAVFNQISLWSPNRQNTRELFKRMNFGQSLINYAIMAMIGAFLSGTCAVLHNDKNLAISACVVPVAIFAFLLSANVLVYSVFKPFIRQ